MSARMRALVVLCVLILQVSGLFAQQKTSEPDYLVAEIRARDDSSQFDFQVAVLSRLGKESNLQSYEAKAPLKLSFDACSFLILQGKRGQGKLGIQYRINKEQKRSFHYIDQGEAVVIQFRPSGICGPGTAWFEGKGWPLAPLVFSSFTKE